MSYLASFFRLLHALFFGVALFKLWAAYQITFNATISTNLQNQVSELLLDFDTLWTVGLLFFWSSLTCFRLSSFKINNNPERNWHTINACSNRLYNR